MGLSPQLAVGRQVLDGEGRQVLMALLLWRSLAILLLALVVAEMVSA